MEILGALNLDTGLVIAILGYVIARLEKQARLQEKVKDALIKAHPELEKVFL